MFRDEQWSVLRKQLLSVCKSNSRKSEKKSLLLNGHEGGNDDDHVVIGAACMWIGDLRSAQFFALENAKWHAAGRCCELSLLEVEDLTLKDVNENGHTFKVLAMKVDRDKQGGSQNLSSSRSHATGCPLCLCSQRNCNQVY